MAIFANKVYFSRMLKKVCFAGNLMATPINIKWSLPKTNTLLLCYFSDVKHMTYQINSCYRFNLISSYQGPCSAHAEQIEVYYRNTIFIITKT